jgi:hypothetical protein
MLAYHFLKDEPDALSSDVFFRGQKDIGPGSVVHWMLLRRHEETKRLHVFLLHDESEMEMRVETNYFEPRLSAMKNSIDALLRGTQHKALLDRFSRHGEYKVYIIILRVNLRFPFTVDDEIGSASLAVRMNAVSTCIETFTAPLPSMQPRTSSTDGDLLLAEDEHEDEDEDEDGQKEAWVLTKKQTKFEQREQTFRQRDRRWISTISPQSHVQIRYFFFNSQAQKLKILHDDRYLASMQLCTFPNSCFE